MIPFIIVVSHAIGLYSAVHAVMSTRTPQGTIAWAVSLVAFPYLTVPAYWVFGRSRFHGYITERVTGMSNAQQLSPETRERLEEHRVPVMERLPAVRAVEGLAGLPPLGGNAVELLNDGAATFDSILAGVDAGEEYVLFQFFIVRDDELGRKVHERLVAKAKAGVRVYFLYDEVGSTDLPKAYIRGLRDAGVHVSAFNARRGVGNRFQINFRNHRKVVVVDGRTAWIGGHNVGDEYLGKDPKFGHWRDTHMRIEGPAALAAQLSFVEDWRWATDDMLGLDWTPRPSDRGDASVAIVPTGPADSEETATLMFIHAINTANERLWIASPYFVPDEAIVFALQLACLRGVDVRILIPDKADHLLVYLAAFSYFDDVEHAGARFYRYTDGFLHQKVMLVDQTAASVGTANFDNRSFRLNFEITAMVSDAEFIAEVERMFEEDFSRSRQMRPGELAERPWWFRFVVRLARLTSPLQ
ncbi:MAG: cardiolipin synthase [Deltaproteobacteria bacterium]|nr:MAG: cardiolipin synthase [Deltaproteobacteria bacterium]